MSSSSSNSNKEEEFVYRISPLKEWEELQSTGGTLGRHIDSSTGCIHLSSLNQLGEGLIYEAADDSNFFPHFYGPSRSFIPLPLDAIIKAEKLTLTDGKFGCTLLS